RGQNTDDRNHDHQFDQGKALLQTFHFSSLQEVSTYSVNPSHPPMLEAWAARAMPVTWSFCDLEWKLVVNPQDAPFLRHYWDALKRQSPNRRQSGLVEARLCDVPRHIVTRFVAIRRQNCA